jgi:hypothetical protein
MGRSHNRQTWREAFRFRGQSRGITERQFWRHNQAGDLPGDGANVDRGGLLAIANANKGVAVSHILIMTQLRTRQTVPQ